MRPRHWMLVFVLAACGQDGPATPDAPCGAGTDAACTSVGIDAACSVGEWCGNDCDPASDACWACGELRYDAACNCRPVTSMCFRPDCSAPGLGAIGDYCGTYWWCDRACGEGLQCLDKPDRPAATFLRTCQ
ncbi:MAG TPA: hypothetical protein VIV11_22430 [Kofleriaceae bacterium]